MTLEQLSKVTGYDLSGCSQKELRTTRECLRRKISELDLVVDTITKELLDEDTKNNMA